MKLLILSDTHRSLGFACEAIEKEAPDAVIHLGDHLGDAEDLSFAYQDPDFYYVPGNCDYAPTVPQMLTLEFDGVRIFATHGHLFGVKRRWRMPPANAARSWPCSATRMCSASRPSAA